MSDSAEDRIVRALSEAAVRGWLGMDELCAILSPPKRHTIGGVVFEETGEVREPRLDDWYLMSGRPVFYSSTFSLSRRTILRPVEIVGDDA